MMGESAFSIRHPLFGLDSGIGLISPTPISCYLRLFQFAIHLHMMFKIKKNSELIPSLFQYITINHLLYLHNISEKICIINTQTKTYSHG